MLYEVFVYYNLRNFQFDAEFTVSVMFYIGVEIVILVKSAACLSSF